MDKLYYISQGSTPKKHLQNIKRVCDTGCQLIQLRLKNTDKDVYRKTAQQALEICKAYNAQFIINDSIEVAIAIGADGVHLGKEDATPVFARQVLGKGKIIGGTANSIEDCLDLIKQGVDYIGLGPYKFTVTKENLSPLLAIQDYHDIVSKLTEKNLKPSIYAIGGIVENDIQKTA